MATYKVIQDIEAEDKLIGPLTLRQFIYGAIAAIFLYLSYIAITKNAYFLLILFLPLALISGFFAFPFGRDQPTEVWALAKIRFILKPHKRIWNQSGIKELVTINVPKRLPQIYTDGLTRDQVASRLKALASTIDTRGWATKNVNVNLSRMTQNLPISDNSDRLVNASSLPQAVSDVDIVAADDVLDEKNNKTASTFEQMIASSTTQHRQQVIDAVEKAAGGKQKNSPSQDWFLNQSSGAPNNSLRSDANDFSQITLPTTAAEEKAVAEKLKSRYNTPYDVYTQHMKKIEPPSSKKQSKKTTSKSAEPRPPSQVTQTNDPAILALANNNDLNVATIARQANKNRSEPPQDEVVITLH